MPTIIVVIIKLAWHFTLVHNISVCVIDYIYICFGGVDNYTYNAKMGRYLYVFQPSSKISSIGFLKFCMFLLVTCV